MLIRVGRGVDFTRNKFTDYMPWTPPPTRHPSPPPQKTQISLRTPPPPQKNSMVCDIPVSMSKSMCNLPVV